MKIALNISHAFHNKELKPGYNIAAFGDSFKPTEADISHIINHLLEGEAITVCRFEGNTRTNGTFISGQLFALDLDNNISVEDALKNPFIRQHAVVVYSTDSSKKVTPKNPNADFRSRVVFVASEPVTDCETYRLYARAIMQHVGLETDESSVKPAQPYFGSTNRVEQPYINLDSVLPLAMVKELAAPLIEADKQKREAAEERRREAPPIDPTSSRAVKYAAATLENMLRELATTTSHRNDAIFETSLKLMSYALGGWPGITAEVVKNEIENIVEGWENTRKSKNTMQRGFKTATAYPLVLPDKPKKQRRRAQATEGDNSKVKPPSLGVPVKKVNRVTDDPELADILKTEALILAQGGTGIGKSYAFAAHSKRYAGDFTGFAQFKLLTIKGAGDNEAEHYENAVGGYRDGFSLAKRVYISINSAPKFQRQGGLIIVDEIEQCVAWALTSKTIQNARNVWRELKACWSSADQFIGMDANLSPVTVSLLEKWTGKHAKVLSYARNTAPRDIKLYDNRNATLEKLQKVLNKHAGLVSLACSSEKLATETAERMTTQGFKVLKITGDNSHTPAIQAASTDPKKRAGFDLIVFTSAAGAGVDFSEEFYASFTILDALPLTPEEGIQLFGRVRHARHYYAFCPTEREIKQTPSAAELIAGKMLEFRQAGQATGKAFALTPDDGEMLSIWGDLEERRIRETANFRAYLIARLQTNGFRVKAVSTRASAVFVAELDAYRKQYSDKRWEYIKLNAEGISLPTDELNKIKMSSRQEITSELKFRNTRWKIEYLLGRLELTDADRIASEPKGRAAIRLGAELLLSPEILLETDLSEEAEGIPIHRRLFRHNRQQGIFTLLQMVGFAAGKQGYLDFIEWILTPRTSAEVDTRLAPWTTPAGLELFQRALGHYGNNAKSATGLLRLFLEKLGFTLIVEKHGKGENYTRLYMLDAAPIDNMLKMQNEAAAAITKSFKASRQNVYEGSYIHSVDPVRTVKQERVKGDPVQQKTPPAAPKEWQFIAGIGAIDPTWAAIQF